MIGINSNVAVTVVLTVVCGAASVLAAHLAHQFWSEGRQVVPVVVLGAAYALCSWWMVLGLLVLWAKTKKFKPRG